VKNDVVEVDMVSLVEVDVKLSNFPCDLDSVLHDWESDVGVERHGELD
jgi:hypothetical protein